MKNFFVYIPGNKKNGTLYTGVTSDLAKRVYEHKNDLVEAFTGRYGENHNRLVTPANAGVQDCSMLNKKSRAI